MSDTAGWIALIATCIGALMTASNLSARVTGWGFVVFTVGAAAWITVGIATHQRQLLISNVFLGLVDLFGIWRWLGRKARIDDTSQAEEERSRLRQEASLFSVARLDGLEVKLATGEVVAHAVDAFAACKGGQIDYLVIRVGGIGGVGEKLFRLPWRDASIEERDISTTLTVAGLTELDEVEPNAKS